jgi:hypothetical protein
MRNASLACLTLLLVACAAPPHDSRFDSEPMHRVAATDTAETSLFTGDAALLSDSDIARILAYNYSPPAHARIGIMGLGQQLWFGYSDELARSGEEMRRDLIATLKQATPVTDASFLPVLLVPSNRSVAHYREAAARVQADLLLIYQASCRTYDKFRMFRPSESKAFCTVEALLLDVRTGIVPFTDTVTRELLITESKDDFNIQETRRRSELDAIRQALSQVATSMASYLVSKT